MGVRDGPFRMDRSTGELTGYEATFRVFKKMQDVTSAKSFSRMLKAQADAVLAKSQDYVPVETEQLKQSGHVREYGATGKAGTVEAAVVYGPDSGGWGSDAYYAVYVHEIPALHAWPTSWKYLQRAVDELWPDLTRIAAESLDLGRSFFIEFGSF